MKQQKEELRSVDKLFLSYGSFHKHKINFIINLIFVPLLVFSIMGMITAVPFPQLAFLGKYNMFINWFSFALALAIYFYLKQSPLLSYLMLFLYGALYFFIVQLEYVERAGGIKLWQMSLILFVAALIMLVIGNRKENQPLPFAQFWKKAVVGPIWLWSLLLKRFKLNY